MNKVEQIKKLISNVPGNRIVTVSFVKKDGTLRTMQCHRSKKLEATVKAVPDAGTVKRKQTLKANNMMGVEELYREDGQLKHRFRTVNLETVQSVHANRQTYTF